MSTKAAATFADVSYAPAAPGPLTALLTSNDVDGFTKSAELTSLSTEGVYATLLALLNERATGVTGCQAVEALATKLGLPFIASALPLYSKVIDLIADKKSNPLRKQAQATATAFLALVPEDAMTVVIQGPLLESGMGNDSKWQSKVAALKLLAAAATQCPRQVESLMTELVPIVSEAMWDTQAKIKAQALETMTAICGTIVNIDLEPFIPELIDTILSPEDTAECVYALAGTTFVQTITASALSITVPILKRGFQERKTAIVRKCAVITENLAKLVKNASDVAPFMPVLEPALARGMKEISDPEAAERFAKAHAQLLKAASASDITEAIDFAELASMLQTSTGAKANSSVVNFSARAAANMGNYTRCFLPAVWSAMLEPVLATVCDAATAAKATAELNAFANQKAGASAAEVVDECDGEDVDVPDLCDLHFSLAYGSNILLNDSRLHLKKGFKYGVIASKSAGKTTMMRAISNGQVEGFPTKEELRCIFIENDIQGSQMEMNVAEFLIDTIGFGIQVTVEEAKTALLAGNFTEVMCNGLITQLSGGWKMKLALIRATLEKADIMLVDEPTNHLDVINVQWVVDYINSLPDTTCLIVSHDTKFLDQTVSHILHFDELKLHLYKGNLSAFLARFPEKAYYFDLSKTTLKFQFPKPTALVSGGKSNKGRTLMEMKERVVQVSTRPPPRIRLMLM